MKVLPVSTKARTTMIKITDQIKQALSEMEVEDGVVTIYCPHTTAAITVNESDDPGVQKDILKRLNDLVPLDLDYEHYERNADAHIKSSLIGSSVQVMVEGGQLKLGQWQAIYFCEFDGPREREIWLKA